jgi:hemerythrin superfamily protein
MSTSKKSSSASTVSTDAIELLTADHRAVKAMFETFQKLKEHSDAEEQKDDLVQRICAALTIHATIEEEIFYPAVREAIDDDDLMDEADVEHASAKELIAQLEEASAGDDHFDAKVTVLGELIEHHVKEEEGEMFAKAKKVIDVDEVGKELAERKTELAAEMGYAEEPADEAKARPASSRASAKRAS